MLNLAIECSSSGGSVALVRNADLLVEYQLPENVGSVQSLAGTIERALSFQSARRVDLISVTYGPGSFTGLRAGLATAKMLAFAWNIPIMPVCTLKAIAFRGRQRATEADSPAIVVPVLNAFRRQVFTAAWVSRTPAEPLQMLAKPQVVAAAEWQQQPFRSIDWIAPANDESVLSPPDQAGWNSCAALVTGPGLRNYLPAESAENIRLSSADIWDPRAADVATLGLEGYLAGQAQTARELQPNYVRASAAEENHPKQ